MDILGGHEVLVGTYEEYVLGYAPKEDKSGMSLSMIVILLLCRHLEKTNTILMYPCYTFPMVYIRHTF